MRFGRDNNFLSIEPIQLDGGYPAFRAEAVATGSGRRFTASHDRLMFDTSEAITKGFADFEALHSDTIEVPFSESGWLRLQRDARGYITVRYRIGGWKTYAAMEGEILVEGEYAGRVCREFGALLRSGHAG